MSDMMLLARLPVTCEWCPSRTCPQREECVKRWGHLEERLQEKVATLTLGSSPPRLWNLRREGLLTVG